ncbi:MAG TPA: F0F1 ATP synthase subunit B [Vicinamibacteria bacterium]
MPVFALSSLLLGAGGGSSLTDIDFNLTLWTLVLFVLFAGVLWKFAWGPILATIDAREKSVRDEVEGAHKANAEATQLLEKHKELVRDAGRERDEMLKRTRAEAEQIKADLQTKARGEAEAILERAREQIGRERDAAITVLRAQVADVAIEAAARIVQSSLSKDAQRKIVDEFVSSLEKQTGRS